MAIVILFQLENGDESELLLVDKTTIGRSSKTDYQIEDTKISGKHCSLEINKEGQVIFMDLNSTNGSYINDQKIETYVFRVGDEIKIGNTTISIDPKRLNMMERAGIGKSVPVKTNVNDNLTLPPEPAKKNTVSIVRVKDKDFGKKNNIGVSKSLIEVKDEDLEDVGLTLDNQKKKKK